MENLRSKQAGLRLVTVQLFGGDEADLAHALQPPSWHAPFEILQADSKVHLAVEQSPAIYLCHFRGSGGSDLCRGCLRASVPQ